MSAGSTARTWANMSMPNMKPAERLFGLVEDGADQAVRSQVSYWSFHS